MNKVNNQQLLEVIFDQLSDNDITFRQFAVAFFLSRVKNKISFCKTLILTIKDVRSLKPIDKEIHDSKNDHPDLFNPTEEN